ncbi:MAG TPA: phosphotransferase family protein [Polyangiaceae bacterium]|nr:phosphotransferase family protein [Polyangiaceae bacterium]
MSTTTASPAAPSTPAPGAEKKALFTDWLRRELGGDVEITGWDAPEGVGHSNETILVEARSGKGDLSLVVRVQAEPPAVFPHYDLSLQCECMRRVAAHSDVPVPRVRWFDPQANVFGRPFYVMDRIDGTVPADRLPYTMSGWLFDASPAQQTTLVESSLTVLAAIHRIDWKKAGLALLDRPEHGATGLGQQLAWWISLSEWVRQGRPQPTIDGATAWLRSHLPSPSGPTVLNWGDARLSNLMYRDFRPVAVLDWEMATLGPAEVDVGWFLFFQRFFSEGLGVPDLPGFPARAAALAHYEKLAGRELDDLFFYEVFAAWRNATVMLRIADIYETRGFLSPESGAGQNNVATRLLARMLDLPSPGDPGGPFG